MNLPNYYLADLPPEAVLTPGMLEEACLTLRKNRERYLLDRSTASIVRVIAELADSWRQEQYPFRQEVLASGPRATGFSAATLARGLDNFFAQLTEASLNALLVQDLGHLQRLDRLATGENQKHHAVALGPEFLVHITAGNIPNPALMSIILGLLTRSAQFVKCSSGAAYIPRLFAHSLYELEPKLGACLEIAAWPGGQSALETVLYHEANCVTAAGSDETVEAIRRQLPPRTRFLGYGHRVSFAFIGQEELTGFNARKLAARITDDVAAWDQLGCLSPHVIYVERNGRVSSEQFAEMLADEQAQREAVEPRGQISLEAATAIASRRSFYEVRAAHVPDTRQWCSQESTAWTVIHEADPRFQMSCLHRFVYVKAVENFEEALQGADSVRHQVSTVGLGVGAERQADLALRLARWGATRICPLGQMQNPPITWRHDGRPALADLVTWADWES
jgi:hypothetical protein